MQARWRKPVTLQNAAYYVQRTPVTQAAAAVSLEMRNINKFQQDNNAVS